MTVRGLQSEQRRFVVLDRDGTIIGEREYLSEPEQVALLPGVGAALRELQQMGFGLVVITNQSGVGRGIFDQAQLECVHERLRELLEMLTEQERARAVEGLELIACAAARMH